MQTYNFTLIFKNNVELHSNSSLLSDIHNACALIKQFKNIKTIKKDNIYGNKVHVILSIKQKLSKKELNDAVNNVIHLLKKKNYKFKSSKTIKEHGKKSISSIRKTRKQTGGSNIYDLKKGDIASFTVNRMSETHRYILFNFSQYVTSSGMLGGKSANYRENVRCAEFIPSITSQIIDITNEDKKKIIGENLTTNVIIALDTMSNLELLKSPSPSSSRSSSSSHSSSSSRSRSRSRSPSSSRSRSRSRYGSRARSRYGSRARSRSRSRY